MSSVRPPVVVIGLDCITGLQTARIFARRGVPVIAVARDTSHYCCRTNVCERIVQAETKTEALIPALESLGATLDDKAVLVPCTDMSVLLLSRFREQLLPWFKAGLPAKPVVETLIDKIGFYRYAEGAGLPIPVTFFLENRSDAERAAGALGYPCILKPPIKSPAWERNTTRKVFKLANAAEFLACYDRCAGWADVLMVQDWIPGGDDHLYSCNCYFSEDNRPLVTFIARKLRQWPPETGTSCLGEEVRNDEVLETSIRLFQGIGYHGLGYVEMKRDPRTGRQYIIEPNIGRPTGRSAIAEEGGVELLLTMYCDLAGLPRPAAREQQYRGAKWIYLRRDLQSAWHDWRRGALTVTGWLRSLAGVRHDAVFAWRDPVPFIADLAGSAASVFGGQGRHAAPTGRPTRAGV